MVLLGAAAVVVIGGLAYLMRAPRPVEHRGTAVPDQGNAGSSNTSGAEVQPLPPKGGSEELKFLTVGVSIVGTVAGLAKGAVGALGGTAGSAAGASGGVSLSVIGGWAVAIAAVVGFVVFGVMIGATDFENLKNGAFGYMQNQLLKVANETAEKFRVVLMKPKSEGGHGLSELQARSLSRLIGFAVAVGYNRAAWAYVKRGAQREVQFGANTGLLGITPEFRHEAYYVARAYGLPDEPGYIYEPIASPPPPPNWSGTWPPPPPLLDGRQWSHTLEWFMFRGVNTTRAQCIADAGGLWTPELEALCDFIGRASRCSYALHNKLGPGGQALFVASNEGAVRFYAQLGCIGLPPIKSPSGVFPSVPPHPPGAENAVVDSARQCIRSAVGSNVAWFFSETIEHGAVPVRSLV